MSDTTSYSYSISGVTFEDGGTLSGTVTVTYSAANVGLAVYAVDLTTTAGTAPLGSLDAGAYNSASSFGSADYIYSASFVHASPSDYQILIYGQSSDLYLGFSGTQPSALSWDFSNPTKEYEHGNSEPRAIGSLAAAGTITAELACFAAGTKLLTDRGEVPVEALRVGDRLPTLLSGRLAPIRWIGTRTLDTRRHPRPWDVAPVRIRAGAFGPGQPTHDLVLSPDHAVLVDDALVPVRYLLNGATIVQLPPGVITYFHVELDAHDVVSAQGLPAETYLDTGNRAAFENAEGATAMSPEFARAVWAASSCAKLLTEGPALVAIRQLLLDRAHMMGYTQTADPALILLADGAVVAGRLDGQRRRFDLPLQTRHVRILSRHAIPAEAMADSLDGRRLGVGIAGLTLDGTEAAAGARLGGWHPPEPGWQWTDGDATLAVGGARTLDFAVVLVAAYWVLERDGEPARIAA